MGIGQLDPRGASVTVAASDSPFRYRADYVCDAVDAAAGINAAIDKISSVGGKVRLLSGTYTITNTQILQKNKVYIEGAGVENTVIQAADSHNLASGTGLVKLDGTADFDGGGLSGVSLIGDGGIDGDTSRADLTATVDGIDANGAGN